MPRAIKSCTPHLTGFRSSSALTGRSRHAGTRKEGIVRRGLHGFAIAALTSLILGLAGCGNGTGAESGSDNKKSVQTPFGLTPAPDQRASRRQPFGLTPEPSPVRQ